MALETYKQKRNFAKTPEPRAQRAVSHQKPFFVVQEHHASRLHYDFRLEADGVLKSWAVPKQPSHDPAVKRLAARVEDHPLDYADFKGVIPKGQYGAGVVKIWDRGSYENKLATKPQAQTVTEGIEAGHVEVRLHGRKLKGDFALIRMNGRSKKDNWLLIKMKDKQARSGSADGNGRTGREVTNPTRVYTAARRSGRSRSSTVSPVAASIPKPLHPRSVEFSHANKIMFPEMRITKRDVLHFYEKIAARLLPHLCDRPVTLERLPEGLAGKGAPYFWQKNIPPYYPAWIPRAELPSETGKPVHYALVNDCETLLYLVNQGARDITKRCGNKGQAVYLLG